MSASTDRLRVELSPGFLLLMGVLIYLDDGVGLLPWALLACLLHELGHMAAAFAMGGRVERLSLSAVGAELSFCYDRPLSYLEDSAVALAGPLANLITGGAALGLGAYLLAVLSMGVGAFNLLPIPPLDGGRVLYGLLAQWLEPVWVDRITAAAAGILVGLLVGAGAVAAAKFANVTLLLTALWLLSGVLLRGGGRFSPKKR